GFAVDRRHVRQPARPPMSARTTIRQRGCQLFADPAVEACFVVCGRVPGPDRGLVRVRWLVPVLRRDVARVPAVIEEGPMCRVTEDDDVVELAAYERTARVEESAEGHPDHVVGVVG